MQTMIDILGAMFIGAMLMLVALKAMDNGLQNFVNHNADAIVQSELATTSQILQNDLRKMGYGVPESQQGSILQIAQPTHLKYLSHLNHDIDYLNPGGSNIDNVIDTIDYNITPFDTVTFIDTSIVLFGVNRTIKVSGSSALSSVIGTTTEDTVFRYLNQAGIEVSMAQATKMVEVTLIAVNPNIYVSDEVLAADNPQDRMVELRRLLRESFWRQTRVISRNLRR